MIEFNKTFGKNSGNVGSGAQQDRPKAQFWLNFGYLSDVTDEEGNQRFVSIPTGIPLDTQEPLAIPHNRDFAAFRAAQNDLLAQLQTAAKKLAPGEERIIALGEVFAVQLRRVKEEAVAIPNGENPFAKVIGL